MRIHIDSQKYAKMLIAEGFPQRSAEALMSVLTKVEIQNLFSIPEVNSMLSQAIKDVFIEQKKALAEQRREFDAHLNIVKKELREDLKEGRDRSDRIYQNLMNEVSTSRRWTIATIMTVGISIATYLAALFRLIH